MAFSKDDKIKFIEVLRAKNLHVGKACEAFKVSRVTYYEWLKDEWFAELVKELEEREIDDSEEMHRWLRSGIPKVETLNGIPTVTGWHKEPDRVALETFLRTKGKKRGWQEENRITGTGASGEIVIVRIPDNGRDSK